MPRTSTLPRPATRTLTIADDETGLGFPACWSCEAHHAGEVIAESEVTGPFGPTCRRCADELAALPDADAVAPKTPRKPTRVAATRTTTRVLADFIAAADAQRPVTIEYRAKDGTTTRRTIEPRDFRATASGVLVVAWCRLRREERTFLVTSVVAYTVHSRTGRFVGDLPDEEPTRIAPIASDHEGNAGFFADAHDRAEARGESGLAWWLWLQATSEWAIADANAAEAARWLARRQQATSRTPASTWDDDASQPQWG